MVRPRAFPNDRATCDDWQTAQDQKNQSNIGKAGGQIPSQKDEDKTDSAKGELEKDGVEIAVPKCAYDQRTKSTDSAVHSVR